MKKSRDVRKLIGVLLAVTLLLGVADMNNMFSSSNATMLDVSSFKTSKVTNMYYMFKESKNLKTIFVSKKFDVTNVTNSSDMFSYASVLTGGAGTVYSSSNPADKTYARVNGGTSSPGYFTLKNN